jgi:hydroxypyruvate reductase
MTTLQGPATPQALLADLYWAAVTAAAPGPALQKALAPRISESRRRVHLLALGKAAEPMAQAAVAALREAARDLAGGLLVVPESVPAPDPRLAVAVGDHPRPGPGSWRAAEQLAHAVAQVRPDDEVWVLLSGGTTSLIGAPVAGVSPADLAALYDLLLGSGLDIVAMNRIRKRFARWAGGRLAVALYPAHVKNFTISDVIGDDLEFIGSGPCVPDTSTAAAVRAALTAAGLWEKIPESLRRTLAAVERGEAPETPKPEHPAFATTETILVASNRLALEAACARARALGLNAVLRDAALAGEASLVGPRLASELLGYDGTSAAPAQDALHKHTVLIWGGETTVTLTPDAGRGGRSQELALAAARTLARKRPDGREVYLLAAGTDGRDGPTDAAGALVDATTWERIARQGRDPERDLRSHRSYEALEAAGALFRTGLTGTNVMDLVVGLVWAGG